MSSGPLGLAILGSTGSVGRSALRVVDSHEDRLRVVSLAAYGRDLETLERQVRDYRPAAVAVADSRAAERLEVPPGVEILEGPDAAKEVAIWAGVDRVVAAVVGAAGLPPVHAAVAAGRDVALANKESLVVAGSILTDLAARTGARILPVDSEHAALHQALRCGERSEVRRLVLTASGGPFRTRPGDTFDTIRPEEALAHPTWDMGAKISIDSATMMNKGLELIEARHLFDLPPERIDVVVHPQSLVHSFVEYRDGSWIAQLSANDMVFPLQYALSYPDRWENDFPRLEPGALGSLEFEAVDHARFPCLGLARRAVEAGGSAPAVLNGSNEVAVRAFLDGQIGFPDVPGVVGAVLDSHETVAPETIEEALAWDAWGRERAREAIDVRRRDRQTPPK